MICFDLETAGNPEALTVLPPPKADSRLKDTLKIALDRQEKTAKRIERAALDLDTCQILALGILTEAGEPLVLAQDGLSEREILIQWWAYLAEYWEQYPTGTVVGFNSTAFDWPIVCRRSQVLRVPFPMPQLSKYRPDFRLIDLMTYLTWNGLVEPKSLTTYCKLFGLDVPQDDSTGADIAALHAAGDWTTIRHHVRADIQKTAALAVRVGVSV